MFEETKLFLQIFKNYATIFRFNEIGFGNRNR